MTLVRRRPAIPAAWGSVLQALFRRRARPRARPAFQPAAPSSLGTWLNDTVQYHH